MLKQYAKKKAEPDSADLKDETIIIIDNCPYSRMACEAIVSDITQGDRIMSFECFTDYRLWSLTAGTASGKRRIIFNAASGPYYEMEVVEFLAYFNGVSHPYIYGEMAKCLAHQEGKDNRHGKNVSILLLASKSRPPLYRNALITHYMVKHNPASSMVVVSDFYHMDVGSVRKTLARFIQGKGAAESMKKRGPCFTPNDIRAMNILLSGENIKTASSRHAVGAKTLYTQRAYVLEKLTF